MGVILVSFGPTQVRTPFMVYRWILSSHIERSLIVEWLGGRDSKKGIRDEERGEQSDSGIVRTYPRQNTFHGVQIV